MASTVLMCGATILNYCFQKRRPRHINRKIWVREWIQNRPTQGVHKNLLQQLRHNDPSGYKNFSRMDSETFDELLKRVGPLITHQDTRFRKAIPPSERLALNLRFITTGMHAK